MTFLQAVLSASFEADQNEEDAYNKGSMYNIDLLVMDGANWGQIAVAIFQEVFLSGIS